LLSTNWQRSHAPRCHPRRLLFRAGCFSDSGIVGFASLIDSSIRETLTKRPGSSYAFLSRQAGRRPAEADGTFDIVAQRGGCHPGHRREIRCESSDWLRLNDSPCFYKSRPLWLWSAAFAHV
jgi:hypothetical protein